MSRPIRGWGVSAKFRGLRSVFSSSERIEEIKQNKNRNSTAAVGPAAKTPSRRSCAANRLESFVGFCGGGVSPSSSNYVSLHTKLVRYLQIQVVPFVRLPFQVSVRKQSCVARITVQLYLNGLS